MAVFLLIEFENNISVVNGIMAFDNYQLLWQNQQPSWNSSMTLFLHV